MDRPLRRHKKFYLNSKSGANIRVSKQSTKCMSVKLKIYVCKIENLWRKKEKGGVRKHKKILHKLFLYFFQTSLIHRELIFVSVHDGINTTCSSRICC